MESSQPQTSAPLKMNASRGFIDWLLAQNISLAFTTYQSSRLFLLGVKPDGRLGVVMRTFDRCMGLWATPERLWLTTRYKLWCLENRLWADGNATAHLWKSHDALYVPRRCYVTGEIDLHDLVVADGKPVFVNTLYSCLGTLSDRYSFTPLWRPPFISKLAPEDRCHLNGVALHNGQPRYVTVCAQTDIVDGWRDHRDSGGCVIDIQTNQVIASGLSMPHSPRVYQGKLWLHNSGTGEFGFVPLPDAEAAAPQPQSLTPLTFCPGYLRGLAFCGDYAIVGLSKPRDDSFVGLALDDRLAAKQVEPWCGLMVIDSRSGDVLHWLRIEQPVSELYDVQVLPQIRYASALSLKGEEVRRQIWLDPHSSDE